MSVLSATVPASTETFLLPEEVLFGCSPVMTELRNKLKKLIQSSVSILLVGENGCGKEVIARYIHKSSRTREQAFTKINCPTATQADLFGSEQGDSCHWRLEQGGTIFFDEIGELELPLQAKLFQFLQDGQEQFSDGIRFIFSTRCDLQRKVETGNFRPDLFYAISAVKVTLPPLRERREDIPVLTEHFLKMLGEKFQQPVPKASTRFRGVLQNHRWPGNIRELQNVITRYVLLGSEEVVAVDLSQNIDATSTSAGNGSASDGVISLRKATRETVREFERKMILRALEANNWNRKRCARALSISYRSLMYKLQSSGIPTKGNRKPQATVTAESNGGSDHAEEG